MAIDVKIQCSECGTVAETRLNDNAEIVCPECRRSAPSLPKEEYTDVARTLSGQRLMGIVALVFAIAAVVLLFMYVGQPDTWISSDNAEFIKRLEKSGLARNADTSSFLYGAGGCILMCMIFGVLSSRKRFLVEF